MPVKGIGLPGFLREEAVYVSLDTFDRLLMVERIRMNPVPKQLMGLRAVNPEFVTLASMFPFSGGILYIQDWECYINNDG